MSECVCVCTYVTTAIHTFQYLPRTSTSDHLLTYLLPLQAPQNNTMNLGVAYDRNYPVIFNIWLWLVIALALSLYAVSIIMWEMDPGRDSIIYRMTSQRIKTE